MALVSAESGAVQLDALVSGLLFISEADYPLEVTDLGASPELDEPSLLRLLNKPAASPITRHSLGELFDRAVLDQPWHGPAERAIAARYRRLLEFMSTALAETRVFRIGSIEVDAYALGRTSDGHWLGIATKLIET